MEAGERIEAGGTYRTPLSIFDVIRMQKLNKDMPCIICRTKEDLPDESLEKTEEADKDFFFPLSIIF